MSYQPRLKQMYLEKVATALFKNFKYKSVMQIPKIEKIVINVGVGEAAKDAKLLDATVNEIALISGQKPVKRKVKKSISNFKIRKSNENPQYIGASVTLRSHRMYDFLDRLITISIPRIRDFQGLSKNSFDGRGNYNFGIKEQTVFPEIKFDQVKRPNGLNITIVTTANTDEESLSLLEEMGMPFTKK